MVNHCKVEYLNSSAEVEIIYTNRLVISFLLYYFDVFLGRKTTMFVVFTKECEKTHWNNGGRNEIDG